MDCKRASAVEIKSSTSGPMYMMMDQWRIVLTGFGKFTVRKKEPRTGRNPRTGEAIIVPGHKVVTFRPSALWKAELNAAGQSNIEGVKEQ
jgi:nucleoid DNA-binding protein